MCASRQIPLKRARGSTDLVFRQSLTTTDRGLLSLLGTHLPLVKFECTVEALRRCLHFASFDQHRSQNLKPGSPLGILETLFVQGTVTVPFSGGGLGHTNSEALKPEK